VVPGGKTKCLFHVMSFLCRKLRSDWPPNDTRRHQLLPARVFVFLNLETAGVSRDHFVLK